MKLKDQTKDLLRCRGYTHMNYLRAIEDTGINWLHNIPYELEELENQIYASYNPKWITRDLVRRKWFKKDLLNNLKLLSMAEKILSGFGSRKSPEYSSKMSLKQRKYYHFTFLLNTFNQNKNRHI